jgi:dTDP-L-rhamnose 4-epimerase
MKILVTGGAGFIGQWLVAKLPADTDVVVVDCLDEQVHSGNPEAPPMPARADFIKADIRDTHLYAGAAEGADAVVHLAAQTGTGQSMYETSRYLQHNVYGTERLLELIGSLKRSVRRIILVSSRAVYGEGSYGDTTDPFAPAGRPVPDLRAGRWAIRGPDGDDLTALPMREDHSTKPTSVYGLTKLRQEELVEHFARSAGLDFLTLRLQNVYGPGQALGNPYAGIVGIFIDAVAHEQTIDLFEDGEITRDFVYVEDIADALVRAICHPEPLRMVLNCGSGIATTLRGLLGQIEVVVGKKPDISCTGTFRIGDVRHAVADMQRYREVFGSWTPTDLDTGLRRYFDWYLSQPQIRRDVVRHALTELEEKGLLGHACRA